MTDQVPKTVISEETTKVMGLYAIDKKTGEMWWFTGEDTSPVKSPYLRDPTHRVHFIHNWEQRCAEALSQVMEGRAMWWCRDPALFYTQQTFTVSISDSLPLKGACPDRADLRSPGEAVRNAAGVIVGCKGLCC